MTTSLQKFIDELQLRGRSLLTQKHYARIISALARHYQRPPDQISDDELKQYLLHLLRERHLAASTLVVTVSAFRFYYRHVLHRSTSAIEEALPRMKAPTTQPRIYSPQEVERLLNVPGLIRHGQHDFSSSSRFTGPRRIHRLVLCDTQIRLC